MTLLYKLSPTFHSRVSQGITNTQTYFSINNQMTPEDFNKKIQTSFGNRLFHLEQTSTIMLHSSLLVNIIGNGTGSYQYLLKEHIHNLPKTNIFSYAKPIYWGADNVYLTYWFENGLIGAIVFLFGVIYLYRNSQKIDSQYKDIAKVGLLILLVASACANMNMYILSRIIFIPIMIAYMYGLKSEKKDSIT